VQIRGTYVGNQLRRFVFLTDVACLLVAHEFGFYGFELPYVFAPDFFDLLAGESEPIFAEVILADALCDIATFFQPDSYGAKHTASLAGPIPSG
jgi:hypothetical protein